MCLSIAIARPHDVLASGVHAGHEWVVTNNGRGYRCGYVKLGPGHPWYGKDDMTIHDEPDGGPRVHGGITFAGPDVHCGKGGPDDGWWIGFDCNHYMDAADPSLPQGGVLNSISGGMDVCSEYVVRTQEYVESECRGLCEQAAAVAAPAP